MYLYIIGVAHETVEVCVWSMQASPTHIRNRDVDDKCSENKWK